MKSKAVPQWRSRTKRLWAERPRPRAKQALSLTHQRQDYTAY
jgi:hypothetical protein